MYQGDRQGYPSWLGNESIYIKLFISLWIQPQANVDITILTYFIIIKNMAYALINYLFINIK